MLFRSCGSYLTNENVKSILGDDCYTVCTQLQVASSIMGFIDCFLLKYKNDGLNNSEDLDITTKYINYIKPYMGKFYCKEITDEIIENFSEII